MPSQTFTIKGMTCGHCEAAVTAELSKLPGVAGVRVDLAAGTATVMSDQTLAAADVASAIDEAGYELV